MEDATGLERPLYQIRPVCPLGRRISNSFIISQYREGLLV